MIRFYTPGKFEERIFNQMMNNVEAYAPKTNIIKNENEIIIELAIPGYLKEQIEIKTVNENLYIKGKPELTDLQKQQYLSKEFELKPFEKSYRFTKIMNIEEIRAQFQNGILTLTIPKYQEQKWEISKQIKIN